MGLALAIGSVRSAPRSRWDLYPPLLGAPARHSAIPLERIGGFRGTLAADSTVSTGAANPSARHLIRLREVISADRRIRAEASGHVALQVADGDPLLRGREIVVDAGLSRSTQPGRVIYVSRASADAVRVGGYRTRLASFRARALLGITERFDRLDPPAAALLGALVLGRREELSPEVYRGFRQSGSLHLLALSGLHLGILYLLLCLLPPLRLIPDRRVRRLAAAAVLAGYVGLVGLRPSLERALVMLLVAALGWALDREAAPLNLLGFAAALLLAVHPHYAFDLSFQLSFLSLASILLLSPFVQRTWQPYLPPFLGWPLAVSLSAQVGTAPLLLHAFGALHPIGVIAALPLIPLVTVFMAAGLLYLVMSVLPFAPAAWLGGTLSLMQRSILFCTQLFARVPGLYWSWRSAFWLLLALPLIPQGLHLLAVRRLSGRRIRR